jgi:hypothetical protein
MNSLKKNLTPKMTAGFSSEVKEKQLGKRTSW